MGLLVNDNVLMRGRFNKITKNWTTPYLLLDSDRCRLHVYCLYHNLFVKLLYHRVA